MPVGFLDTGGVPRGYVGVRTVNHGGFSTSLVTTDGLTIDNSIVPNNTTAAYNLFANPDGVSISAWNDLPIAKKTTFIIKY